LGCATGKSAQCAWRAIHQLLSQLSKGLSPEEYHWSTEKFQYYGADTLYEDVFVNGYADMAICQPTYLKEFYVNGFNTTEQNAVLRDNTRTRCSSTAPLIRATASPAWMP
jgi:serine phosphatase RsbU (regulator of sigma subunit)